MADAEVLRTSDSNVMSVRVRPRAHSIMTPIAGSLYYVLGLEPGWAGIYFIDAATASVVL